MKKENISVLRRPVCNLIAYGSTSNSDRMKYLSAKLLEVCGENTKSRAEVIGTNLRIARDPLDALNWHITNKQPAEIFKLYEEIQAKIPKDASIEKRMVGEALTELYIKDGQPLKALEVATRFKLTVKASGLLRDEILNKENARDGNVVENALMFLAKEVVEQRSVLGRLTVDKTEWEKLVNDIHGKFNRGKEYPWHIVFI